MEQPRPRRDSVTIVSSTSSSTPGGIAAALTSTVSAPGRRPDMVSTPSIDLGDMESEGPATHSASTTPVPSSATLPPPLHPTESLLCSSASSSISNAQPLSTRSEMVKVIAVLLDPEYV